MGSRAWPSRSVYRLSAAQPRAQSCHSVSMTLKDTQSATSCGSRGAANRSSRRPSCSPFSGGVPMYWDGCAWSFCGSWGWRGARGFFVVGPQALGDLDQGPVRGGGEDVQGRS